MDQRAKVGFVGKSRPLEFRGNGATTYAGACTSAPVRQEVDSFIGPVTGGVSCGELTGVGSLALNDLVVGDLRTDKGGGARLSVGDMVVLRRVGFETDQIERMYLASIRAVPEPGVVASVGSVESSDVESVEQPPKTRAEKRALRQEQYHMMCDRMAEEPGFCYLRMIKNACRKPISEQLGPNPLLRTLLALDPVKLDMPKLERLRLVEVNDGVYHVGEHGDSLLEVLKGSAAAYPWCSGSMARALGSGNTSRAIPLTARLGAAKRVSFADEVFASCKVPDDALVVHDKVVARLRWNGVYKTSAGVRTVVNFIVDVGETDGYLDPDVVKQTVVPAGASVFETRCAPGTLVVFPEGTKFRHYPAGGKVATVVRSVDQYIKVELEPVDVPLVLRVMADASQHPFVAGDTRVLRYWSEVTLIGPDIKAKPSVLFKVPVWQSTDDDLMDGVGVYDFDHLMTSGCDVVCVDLPAVMPWMLRVNGDDIQYAVAHTWFRAGVLYERIGILPKSRRTNVVLHAKVGTRVRLQVAVMEDEYAADGGGPSSGGWSDVDGLLTESYGVMYTDVCSSQLPCDPFLRAKWERGGVKAASKALRAKHKGRVVLANGKL